MSRCTAPRVARAFATSTTAGSCSAATRRYRVYLAPDAAGTPLSAEAVQRTARHVLPVAPARYEALPVTLAEGSWLVSVGAWVVRLRLEVPARPPAEPPVPDDGKQVTTRAGTIVRRGGGPGEDAVARVRGYFERNATARLTMAYYYQEFILGLAAPQTVPMMDVVIALDLSGEGAVSDYKKLLQGFIWKERGHARDLADFLLANGLLTPADLDEARRRGSGQRAQRASARWRGSGSSTARRASELAAVARSGGPTRIPAEPSASVAFALIGSFAGPGATAPYWRVRYLPKLSNSPFCAPPRNACHSSGVNGEPALRGPCCCEHRSRHRLGSLPRRSCRWRNSESS